MLELLINALFTWRVSNAIVHEAGPFGLLVRFRSRFGIVHDDNDSPIGHPTYSVLACVWCLSLYVGCLSLVLHNKIKLPLAISALAIIIHEKIR